jgi:hypothetical protein
MVADLLERAGSYPSPPFFNPEAIRVLNILCTAPGRTVLSLEDTVPALKLKRLLLLVVREQAKSNKDGDFEVT